MLGWAENYRAWLHIFSIIYDVSGNSAAAAQGTIITGVDQTIIIILDAGFPDQLHNSPVLLRLCSGGECSLHDDEAGVLSTLARTGQPELAVEEQSSLARE